MKVLIWSATYKPSVNGVVRSIEFFEKGLAMLGVEVKVLCPHHTDENKAEKNTIRVKSFYLGKSDYPLILPITSSDRNKIREFNPDLIHAQHPFITGDDALNTAKRLSIPIVFTYHTKYEEYSHYLPLIPKSFSKQAIRDASVRYSNKVKQVISPSESIKEYLIKIGVTKPISVVPTGLVSTMKSNKSKEELRKKLNLPSDIPVILCVCRYAKEKNQKFLLRTFSKMLSSGFKAHLVLVGPGDYFDEVKTESERVNITGNTTLLNQKFSRKELSEFYSTADIFAYSSMTETQGIIIIEAMSAGLPVVALNSDGIRDVVENGKNGYLLDENEEAFSNTLIKVLSDPNSLLRLSKNALKTSLQFSPEACSKKLVSVYQRALAH